MYSSLIDPPPPPPDRLSRLSCREIGIPFLHLWFLPGLEEKNEPIFEKPSSPFRLGVCTNWRDKTGSTIEAEKGLIVKVKVGRESARINNDISVRFLRDFIAISVPRIQLIMRQNVFTM